MQQVQDTCDVRIGGNLKSGCTFVLFKALSMADTWQYQKVGFCSLGFPEKFTLHFEENLEFRAFVQGDSAFSIFISR